MGSAMCDCPSTSLVKIPSWRVVDLATAAHEFAMRLGRNHQETVARGLILAAREAGTLGHVYVSVADLLAVSPMGQQ